MIKNDFSTKSLLQVLTRHEIIKFSLGRCREDYKESMSEISERISSQGLSISKIKNISIRGKTVFYAPEPEEHFALKKINFDIKRIYKIKQISRDEITEQVLRVLETASAFGIIKIDVKSFYESIRFDEIIEKLHNDKLLNHQMIYFLKELSSLTKLGLPRGLSICSTLSELYMRDVDSKIRELDGVYYYSRYVDDILIITTSNTKEISNKAKSILSEKQLSSNRKSYTDDVEAIGDDNKIVLLDYLGYKFNIHKKSYLGKRVVDVTLADDKVRKIKTRIIHSLIDRVMSTHSAKIKKELLNKRINLLASNHPIHSTPDDDGSLKGGIYYSNRLVNKAGVFEEFNLFLRKALYCKKNNFFGKIIKSIPKKEKEVLREINFRIGFEKKRYMALSSKEMDSIKECWKHQNHKRKRCQKK